jgi:hypothetical protein
MMSLAKLDEWVYGVASKRVENSITMFSINLEKDASRSKHKSRNAVVDPVEQGLTNTQPGENHENGSTNLAHTITHAVLEKADTINAKVLHIE